LTAAAADVLITDQLTTDDIEFPVDLNLEMVLGDMPQKVSIPWNVGEHLLFG